MRLRSGHFGLERSTRAERTKISELFEFHERFDQPMTGDSGRHQPAYKRKLLEEQAIDTKHNGHANTHSKLASIPLRIEFGRTSIAFADRLRNLKLGKVSQEQCGACVKSAEPTCR